MVLGLRGEPVAGKLLKKFYELFSCQAGFGDNLFEQTFTNVNACVDWYSNSFVGFRVYKRKVAPFLTVFRKTSTFQGPYEFFSSNDWNFRAHQGRPIEISSTCTNFSA